MRLVHLFLWPHLHLTLWEYQTERRLLACLIVQTKLSAPADSLLVQVLLRGTDGEEDVARAIVDAYWLRMNHRMRQYELRDRGLLKQQMLQFFPQWDDRDQLPQ